MVWVFYYMRIIPSFKSFVCDLWVTKGLVENNNNYPTTNILGLYNKIIIHHAVFYDYKKTLMKWNSKAENIKKNFSMLVGSYCNAWFLDIAEKG